MNENKGQFKIWILVGGLHPARIGGKEKQALCLANYLSNKNEVTLLTRFHPKHITKNISYRLLQIRYIYLPIIRYLFVFFASLIKITKYRDEIDCLICFGTGDDALKGLFAKKLFRIPFIFSIRGESSYQRSDIIQSKIILPLLVENSEFIHIQTNKSKQDFIKKYPNDKTIVIPNGIDLLEGRRCFNFKEKKNQIIYIGRLIRQPNGNDKGIRFLIEAMDKLPKNLECLIIGDGPERKNLEELAKGKNVKFVGEIKPNMVYKYLSKSKVFVLPSVHGEGFPNVILEAMVSGIPSVATNCGGIPDVIEHGKTGFLVEPRNPKQLAFYINKLLNDDKLWNAISKNCIKEVQKYSWDNVIQKFEKVLEEVIINYQKGEK